MTQQTLQDSVHDWQSDQGITDATMIAGQIEVLTEAVQALTEEQRTANLLAFQSNVEYSYVNRLRSPRSKQAQRLNRAIIERLGLA